MKASSDLRSALRAIDRRSYPAYKSLAGGYAFGRYVLSIDHVQGDPFAAPSRLSVAVDRKTAGFPEQYLSARTSRTALADYLLRRFYRQKVSIYSSKARWITSRASARPWTLSTSASLSGSRCLYTLKKWLISSEMWAGSSPRSW